MQQRRLAYKKMVRWIAALLVIAIAGVWYGLQEIDAGLCANTAAQTVVSPDGQLKAVVFERDCGATTRASIQVSVLRVTQSLPNEAGTILVIDGPNSSALHAAWAGARTLEIQCPAQTRVFHQATTAEVSLGLFRKTAVTIRYTKATKPLVRL